MKAYVICIIITLLLNIFSEVLFKKKLNKLAKLFLIISLLVTCVIAGARNITVGTDVKGYVVRLVNVANTYSNILSYIRNANSDFLFAILIYIGNLFKDMNVVLFFIQFAVAAPIYYYAYKERKSCSITLTLLIFFLNMYCLSLSMMRQSIAISLCVLSYYYISNKKYKKGLFINLCACLFHKTAIIFLIIVLLKKYLQTKSKNKDIAWPAIILLMLIVTPVLDKIIALTDYSGYLDNEEFFREFSIESILKRVFFVVLWIICWSRKNSDEYKDNILFGLIISSVSVYCTILSFFIPGMGRLGYYFFNLNNFLTIKDFPKRFKPKWPVLLILIAIYIFLWWNMTCVPNDLSGVYPYESDIIKYLN